MGWTEDFVEIDEVETSEDWGKKLEGECVNICSDGVPDNAPPLYLLDYEGKIYGVFEELLKGPSQGGMALREIKDNIEPVMLDTSKFDPEAFLKAIRPGGVKPLEEPKASVTFPLTKEDGPLAWEILQQVRRLLSDPNVPNERILDCVNLAWERPPPSDQEIIETLDSVDSPGSKLAAAISNVERTKRER